MKKTIKIRVTDRRIGHEKVIDFTLEGLLSTKGFLEILPPYKDGDWEIIEDEILTSKPFAKDSGDNQEIQ